MLFDRLEDETHYSGGRSINGESDDTVIEEYHRLIERRNQEGLHGFPTILGLDTFYMKNLEDGHFSRAARRFRKVNPSDVDLILIPPIFQPDTNFSCPKQHNDVNCGVFLTWFAERLSRGQPIERRQFNTLVCELKLEYDVFMAELSEACVDYAEEVSADPIPDISVDDRNLSWLVFNDKNWLDISWQLQQEQRASTADPPHLVPEISSVTATNSIPTSRSQNDLNCRCDLSLLPLRRTSNSLLETPQRTYRIYTLSLSLIADEHWPKMQLGKNQPSSQVTDVSATSRIEPTPSSSNPIPTTSTSNPTPTTFCPNPSSSSNDVSHCPEPRQRQKRKRVRKKTIICPGGVRIKIPKRFLRM
ncbi:hypothetical protein J6590_053035 [Homalodisca vitripennis]|nr:hypothetical protein J6590_053035 [Homalodisca vitripennis]